MSRPIEGSIMELAVRPTGDRPVRETSTTRYGKKTAMVKSPGSIAILNGHVNTHSFKERRARLANEEPELDWDLETEGSSPETVRRFSLHQLGMSRLPKGISLMPNGYFPIRELGNTEILVAAKPDKIVTEVTEPAVEDTPLMKEASRRRFIQRQGKAYRTLRHVVYDKDELGYFHRSIETEEVAGTKGVLTRRPHQTNNSYGAVDKIINRALSRRASKIEVSAGYQEYLEDHEEEQGWRTYLEMGDPVTDFPEEETYQTKFSPEELEEFAKTDEGIELGGVKL